MRAGNPFRQRRQFKLQRSGPFIESHRPPAQQRCCRANETTLGEHGHGPVNPTGVVPFAILKSTIQKWRFMEG